MVTIFHLIATFYGAMMPVLVRVLVSERLALVRRSRRSTPAERLCGWKVGMAQSAQDLLDVINSTNRSIADKCQTIDRYLSGNSDNLRGFFENCFPVLVKCIFGYDRAGWLSDISKVH